MRSRDTSPEADRIQQAINARMSKSERLREALQTMDFLREVKLAKIRSLHPDWTEAQVAKEFVDMQIASISPQPKK